MLYLSIFLIIFSTVFYNPNIFYNYKIFIFELKKFIELSKRNYINLSIIDGINILTNSFYLNFTATFFLYFFSKNLALSFSISSVSSSVASSILIMLNNLANDPIGSMYFL